MSVNEYFNNAWASVKQFWIDLDVKNWLQEVAGSSSEVVDTALCFGLSFGVGFLFKRYFKSFFFTLLACVVVVKVLEYNQFITMHWDTINDAFGVGADFTFNAFAMQVIDWVKLNFILFIVSLLGFLVGYKLG